MVTFTYLHINIFKLFICFDIFIYPKLAIDTYIHMYTCIHVYIYTQCTYKTKLSGEYGKNNNNNQTDSKNAIADTDTNSQTNANKT